MTWFATVFALIINSFVAVLMFVMPAIVQRTLPLGVSIPRDRVDEPVVNASVRRYRVGVAIAWAVSVIAALVLLSAPAIAVAVSTGLIVVLGIAAYLLSRSSIRRAKNDGDWYESATVRLVADVRAPESFRPPTWWAIASLAILAAVAVIGIVVYPSLPESIPTHWDAAGAADQVTAKSAFSVFGTLFVGVGLVALLYGCSFAVRVSPLRMTSAGSAEDAAAKNRVQRALMSSMLGQLCLVCSALMAGLTLAGWFAPHSSAFLILPIGLIVAIAIVLVVFLVRYGHAMARHASATTGAGHDAPDDDRYWKGGMVYVNRVDPAVFVPKRFGVGWTVNLGSPGGIGIGVAILLILAGSVLVAVLNPGS